MRFDIKNPQFENYAVYLNGQIERSAIEADEKEGWVRTKKRVPIWFGCSREVFDKKHGKVHIIRMEGYEIDYYRSQDLLQNNDDDDNEYDDS